MRREQVVELGEEFGLDLHIFDDGFDDKVAAGKVGYLCRRLDASYRGVALLLRQLPFFHEFVERFGDARHSAA